MAVKLLNPSIAYDPEMSARFVREGRAAALVNDPGVVGVTDFGTLPDGRSFLVMEWVEGQTLEESLGEGGTLPPAEAVRVVLKILAALEAAHVRGVVHRDLKPSNVFLTPGGLVKIADFGAALMDDPLRGTKTEAGLILGTPAYMAPEQALALPTDARADLYAVGCILFRVLSGAPPFRGAALLEVLRQQIEDTGASRHEPSRPPARRGRRVRGAGRSPSGPTTASATPAEMRAVLELALVLLGGAEKPEGRVSVRTCTVLVVDADPATRGDRARRPALGAPPRPRRGRRAPGARDARRPEGGRARQRARPAGRQRPAPARRGAPPPPARGAHRG